MYNYYIQFNKDNKFAGFNIQRIRQETHMVDEEYTEQVLKPMEKVIINENGIKENITVMEFVKETITRKVQAKDKDGNLVFDIIEITPLPENSFVITPEQHGEYLNALNSQLKDVVLVDGEIKIVDKYTHEELAQKEFEQAKIVLITKAQSLLNKNDYRQTKAIGCMYSDEKKQAVLDYMEALREVIRQAELGNLTELPTPSF